MALHKLTDETVWMKPKKLWSQSAFSSGPKCAGSQETILVSLPSLNCQQSIQLSLHQVNLLLRLYFETILHQGHGLKLTLKDAETKLEVDQD